MNLYQENILEHYRHPHNVGAFSNADIVQKERNSSCGDELTFYFKVDGDIITDVVFQGEGCAISQAAASMLSDELKGKPYHDVSSLTPQHILDLLGLDHLSPTRMQCALLPLRAVQKMRD